MHHQVCVEEEVMGVNASRADKLLAAETIWEEGKAGRSSARRMLLYSF
jgi:hypothetical protein